jgi:hypothetical protein
MGVNEEFKRFQSIWGLLLVAAGMLHLVNSLEGAFARTLVSCDDDSASSKAADGQLWSGSAKCGNRTLVINQGAKLSSNGQSQESIMKFIMMVSAAVCSEIYGRKPVLIGGLICTTLSVVLFVIATFMDDWARTLFVLGQGLQGAYSPALLSGLVAADLAQRSDTDRVGIYGAEAFVTQTAGTLFGLIAFAMQMFDLANYMPVWILVLAVNASALFLAIKHFPETRLKKSDEKKGILAGTLTELRTYKAMFFDNFGLRVLLLVFLFEKLGSSIEFVSLPILMAYHNMTQAGAILLFFPVGFVGAACVGYVDKLSRKYGMQRTWVIGLTVQLLCGLVLSPLVPQFWWAMYMQVYLMRGVLSGWTGFVSAMDNNYFGGDVSKFICIRALIGHSICVVSAPFYAWLFDAGAETYVTKAMPSLFCWGSTVIVTGLFFLPATGIYKLCMDSLASLANERAAAETAAKVSSEADRTLSKDSPSSALASSTTCGSVPNLNEVDSNSSDEAVETDDSQKKTQ